MFRVSFFLKGGGIVIFVGDFSLHQIHKMLGGTSGSSKKYVEFIGNTDDGRTVSCNFDPSEVAGFTHERPPTGHVLRVEPGIMRRPT